MQRCRLLLSLPGSAQVDSASTSIGQRARLNQLCGHVAKLCVGSLRSVDERCECLVLVDLVPLHQNAFPRR
jgi:hypothetical protein